MLSSRSNSSAYPWHRTAVAWISLLALSVCLPAVSLAGDIEACIQWQQDVEKARQLGARHNRLILLHFWSSECPNCEELEQGAFRDPSFVTALHTTYIPVKINVDKFPQLRRRYRIRRWPTDVVITASGEELHRGLSRRTTGQYQNLLSAIAQHHRGSRQQLSPVLQNSVTRVAQVNHDNNGGHQPHALPNRASLVPPQVTYGIPFEPAPARVAALPTGETGQAGWRPVLSRPSTAADRSSGFVPRWVRVPPQQPASPPAELAEEIVVRQPAQEIVVRQPAQETVPGADPQNIIPPAEERAGPEPRVLPAPHTFANTRLGLGGHCPVTLLGTSGKVGTWVIGDRRWGVVHRDRLYLFAGNAQRDLFLQDPDRYSPVVSGYDPVVLTEHRQLVDGRREFGVTYKGQIYLFSSEATLKRFWQSPTLYKAAVDAATKNTR